MHNYFSIASSSLRGHFRVVRRLFGTMRTTIELDSLTEQEKALRRLLLDVADYMANDHGRQRPVLRFTGGWVRDKLLGTTSKDIDIGISSATGFEFGSYMKQFLEEPSRSAQYGQNVLGSLAKIQANPEKSKHLETVTTRILGLEIDLVNLRKETYIGNSRNPQMDFGTAEEDASRRDATVNALFYNLATSEVEDFTNQGLEDMHMGIIRTPKAPFQTFKDDPLRVLRCVRFASQLGFSIDLEAEHDMANSEIQDSLKHKISRERVGVEVKKMLHGPRPHQALSTIDRVGLYNVIFTVPPLGAPAIETSHWHRAYDMLRSLVHDEGSHSIQKIRSTLKLDAQEVDKSYSYQAWLLCAFTPWAGVGDSICTELGAKPTKPGAVNAAREGLKLDNKNVSIIENAIIHLEEIKASRRTSVCNHNTMVPSKRKQEPIGRDELGMLLRRFGVHWRSSVIFALLVESMSVSNAHDRNILLDTYAQWLLEISRLGLLDAYAIKPLVDGKLLMQASGRGAGQWLGPALRSAMKWQLKHPDVQDPEIIVQAVLA